MEYSNLHIDENWVLVEKVDFGQGHIEFYEINGITEHDIFGIYFSFNPKFNS